MVTGGDLTINEIPEKTFKVSQFNSILASETRDKTAENKINLM